MGTDSRQLQTVDVQSATTYALPSGAAWITAPALLAFLGSEALIYFFANRNFAIPANCCSATPLVFNEAANRLQIIVVLFVFLVAVAATGLKFLSDFRKTFSRSLQPAFYWIVGIGVALILVVGILTLLDVWPETTNLIGRGIFDKAFAVVQPVPVFPIWNRTVLDGIVMIHGLITGAASVAIVIALTYCLAEPVGTNGHATEIGARKHNWHIQSERLRTYLYLGTGSLALGVLFMRAWTMYPTFALEGDDLRPVLAGYVGVVNTYVGFVGIQFTIMLGATVVQVQQALSKSGKEIARALVRSDPTSVGSAAPDDYDAAVQKKLADEKLVLTFGDMAQLALLVLAPFLAGSLPSLSDLLR